jgi:hypothetical protein
MTRIGRSFQLLGECFSVLRQDPELLLFPILSVMSFLAVVASFVVPLFVSRGGAALTHGVAHVAFGAVHYVVLAAFYFFTYFVTAFFNVALVACAGIRLRGGDPTLGDGFRAAFSRIGHIAAWTALAATVGWIIRAIEERVGFIGKIVMTIIGIAWSAATALVVPVLAFEDLGPVDTVKRSISLLKQTWGEEIVGNIGLGVVVVLGFLASVAVAVGGGIAMPQLWYVPVAIGVLLFATTLVVHSTLHGIYQAAIYAYATTGQVPGGFDAELVKQAYRRKG